MPHKLDIFSARNIYYCPCEQNNVQMDFKDTSGAKFLQRSNLVISKQLFISSDSVGTTKTQNPFGDRPQEH